MGKIIVWKDVHTILPRIAGKKTVLVGGCFDMFHYGHFVFLKKAKQLGDFLVVALESDEFIRRNKRDPTHTQEQRAQMLSEMQMVDLIILLPYFKNDADYLNMIKTIKPSFVAVSEKDKRLEKKRKQADHVGVQFKVVTPLLKQYSSSYFTKHEAISCD